MIVCGEVIALNGETARIKTSRPVSCEGCANAGICGTRDMEISAMNFENAKIGDRKTESQPLKNGGLSVFVTISDTASVLRGYQSSSRSSSSSTSYYQPLESCFHSSAEAEKGNAAAAVMAASKEIKSFFLIISVPSCRFSDR